MTRLGRGKTCIVVGPCYYFSLRDFEEKFIEPIVEPLLPAELAWTKMNTSWKKGGRK